MLLQTTGIDITLFCTNQYNTLNNYYESLVFPPIQ